MSEDNSYRLPTTTALTAFDCAARHGSFAGAAKELGTSQPAVSRHIASLERQLRTRLFERSRTGVSLTETGRRFHDAVATGLGMIQSAAAVTIQPSTPEQVVIACSAPASHYVLMPRYNTLRKEVGDKTQIGIVVFNNYSRNLPLDPVADVVLEWEKVTRSEDRTVLFGEAVRPVCSPEYATKHTETLKGSVSGWSGLAFLEPGLPNRVGRHGKIGSRPLATRSRSLGSRASTITFIHWKQPLRARASRSAGGSLSINISKLVRWSRSAMAISNATTIFAACSPSRGACDPSQASASRSCSDMYRPQRNRGSGARDRAIGAVSRDPLIMFCDLIPPPRRPPLRVSRPDGAAQTMTAARIPG